MSRLSGNHLRRLLAFSDLAAEVNRVPQITSVLLPALADLAGAALVKYHHTFGLKEPMSIELGWPSDLFTLANMSAFARLSDRHPLIRSFDRLLAVTPTHPFAISQLMSDREWRSTEIYTDAMKALGGDDQIAMTLWFSTTAAGGVTMTRHGGRFSDQDLELVHLARPSIAAATRRATVAGPPGWVAMQTRPSARWVVPHELPLPGNGVLSIRESQILSLIAEGMTSMAIGRRLCISHRTVDKHVQNLHRKLGVSSSTSAIQYLTLSQNCPTASEVRSST